MRNLELPPRIVDERSDLSEMQMVFLDNYILHTCSPKVLFRMLLGVGKSESISNTLMTSLVNSTDGKAYIKQRTEQLDRHFGTGSFEEDSEAEGDEIGVEQMKEIQQKIYKKVSQDLVQDLRDGTLNYKSGAIIEKFMQKALDFEVQKVEAPEPPRIYLPESCSKCRYKLACEGDDAVDECKWCRYRRFALDNGVEYDEKEQLDIPDTINT